MTDRDRETLEQLRFWIKGAGTPEERVPPPQAEADRALGSVLERLEAAERARDTQSGVVAKLIIRERQLEEECSRLRAALRGLDDTMTKADNLLLRAKIARLESRGIEDNARIEAALDEIEDMDKPFSLLRVVKALKGEGK